MPDLRDDFSLVTVHSTGRVRLRPDRPAVPGPNSFRSGREDVRALPPSASEPLLQGAKRRQRLEILVARGRLLRADDVLEAGHSYLQSEKLVQIRVLGQVRKPARPVRTEAEIEQTEPRHERHGRERAEAALVERELDALGQAG